MHLPAASAVAASGRPSALQFGTAALRQATPAEQRTAVGAQFEAILVRQLLGPTLTRMFGTGEGVAANVYGDMLTETLATQLSSGQGLGLGRMIEQQLAPRVAIPAGGFPGTPPPQP
jgi:Rod binding domain-containing protein